ncbi:MAG: IS200/IS605 family transposase [Muribaculaceae bacterium]|nr:IS200/IS605 family transposase [Muribaculaceae bacterium]
MSFIRHYYHIVFTPKHRRPLISQEVEKEVYMLLYHFLQKYKGYVIRINGMPDHVHILVSLPASVAVSEVVKIVKQETSKLIKERRLIRSWEGWEEGYSSFTCSYSEIEKVKTYIINQKKHHQSVTGIEEFREWLISNGISPDSPYFPVSEL